MRHTEIHINFPRTATFRPSSKLSTWLPSNSTNVSTRWTTFDVKRKGQGKRVGERGFENGFLLDFQGPWIENRWWRFGDWKGKERGKKGRLGIEATWVDDPAHTSAVDPSRRVWEGARYKTETTVYYAGESWFSRRFLKVAEPRVTGFREDEIHPERKREGKGRVILARRGVEFARRTMTDRATSV